MEQPGLKLVLIWDAGASGQGINPLRHSNGPIKAEFLHQTEHRASAVCTVGNPSDKPLRVVESQPL